MNTHKNARLTYLRRLEMIHDMTQRGLSAVEAATAHGVSAHGREMVGALSG